MDKEIYEQIIKKKEFSQLPLKDVGVAFSQFEKRETTDEEKIKLTRDLLRRIFSSFGSEKLLNKNILDKKTAEEILKKHSSMRERFEYYAEIYRRIFSGISGGVSVIDLGAGINGFSYSYFRDLGLELPSVSFYFEGGLISLIKYYNKFQKPIQNNIFYVEKELDGVGVE